MAFSPKQKEYFENATHRWNFKSGATRSGKTYMDYYVIPKRIRRVKGKEGLVVILGNTKGSLQRNIILPLQQKWGTALVSDIKSDNTAYMFGELVYCLGADKVSQVDKIRGASIKYCYGDEVVTWNPDVFNMLKSRLDKEYSKFDGTCNPDAPKHWVKQFIDSKADVFSQEYALDDNPFLPESVKENIKREYAGTVFYDRYVLGKWVAASGLVYPMFYEEKHVFKETPEFKKGEFYISIDYGTTNPTSMGVWYVDDTCAYRIKEYYWNSRVEGKQKTDEEYYDALVELAGDLPITAVVIDPSAASFIAVIRQKNKFKVRPANNDVLNGVRYTGTLFNRQLIKISQSCKACVDELLSYRWDEQSEEDKVIKENDHAMDEMRYFCYTVLRHRKNFKSLAEETNKRKRPTTDERINRAYGVKANDMIGGWM